MDFQFQEPQQQSKVGVLLLFLDSLQKILRAIAPIILIIVLKGGTLSAFILFMLLMGTFLLVACIAYLRFTHFTFHIDRALGEFIVYDGILTKTKTVIQLSKIQQVNLTQNLLQRLIGVYGIQVDTAGADRHEAQIKAVSRSVALALKKALIENQMAVTAEETLEDQPESVVPKPFLKIHFISLIKIGITSNYIKSVGLILTFFFSIWGKLHEIGEEAWLEEKIAEQDWLFQSVIYSIVLGIASLFTIVFLINLGRTVLRYFNYTMQQQQGSLLLSFGLINTKNTVLRPSRVQSVVVSQNYFQKKLNVLEMKIRQAISDEKNQQKDRIEVPGCNTREKEAILELIYGHQPPMGLVMKANWRRLVFNLFLTVFLPVMAAVCFKPYFEEVSSRLFFGVLAVYTILLSVYHYFSYKNYTFYVGDQYIHRRSGAWDIAVDILETDKIQAITTSQLFWHKNLNIGSVTLHTAAGNISFYLANFDTLKQYVNRWLYGLESQNHNWM